MTEITFIICVTVYAITRGFIAEYVRKMELENDRRELENEEFQYNQRRAEDEE